MDPDAALAVIRKAVADVITDSAPTNFAGVEAWIALDEWLTHGGFLPAAWNHRREIP